MALNGPILAAAIAAALTAEFGTDYDDIADDHELAGFDQATFWNRYWGACATAIVTHITGAGTIVGIDSGGDNHIGISIV